MQDETLPLTQETVAQMLGVRRPTVQPGRRDAEESRTHRIQPRKREDSRSEGTRERDMQLLQDSQREFDRLQG